MDDWTLFDPSNPDPEPEPEPTPPPPRLIPCPHCRGTGLVPYEPVPSAPARRGDPETSHAAAARHADPDVGRFSTRSVKGSLLREYGRGVELTHYEAAASVAGAEEYHSRVETARRRVGELGDVNYIADTGERRHNPGARAPAIVWRVTEVGMWALQQMEETGWTR